MSDFKDFLRDVGYFGVGAAAVIVEAGGKAVRALVRKGEKTLRDNQDTVDEIKRKAKELGDKVKDTVEKATARPESQEEPTPINAAAMSAEERAELRRQLDEADAACETDAACMADSACEADAACGEPSPEEAPARPVAPDVIYHAGAPIEPAEEEESPEETING